MLRFLVCLCAIVAGCGGGGSDGPAGTALPLVADALDFGMVEVGSPSARRVDIDNPVAGDDVLVTEVRRSSNAVGFTSDFPALPMTLVPGQRLSFTVLWTPGAEGPATESLDVRTDGAALNIPVTGSGFLAETTTDFGLVLFEGGTRRTPELSIDLPADAVSLTIEAIGGARNAPSGGPIVLDTFDGPGGKAYVPGPYIFERNFPSTLSNPRTPRDIAMFAVPNTDRADAQLVPGGGMYTFRLANPGGTANGFWVRVFVELRTGAVVSQGSIPLNVFLAPALNVSALDAQNDSHIQAILARADSLFRGVGLGFGKISYFALVNPQFNTGDPNNPGPLVRASSIAPEPRVNVFLVNQTLFGAAGVSAAIPGPRVNGTDASGLFVLANRGFHPEDLGTVLAHEICHYLGLGHTTEAAGAAPWTEDIIDDTCPGAGCVGNPLNYLMDPSALPQFPPFLTPGQVHVLRRSVHVEASAPTFVSGAPQLASGARLQQGCATCR